MNFPILSLTISSPLIFIVMMIFSSEKCNSGSRRILNISYTRIAITSCILSMVLSIILILNAQQSTSDPQFVELIDLIDFMNLHYHLGVDCISIMFIFLTNLLTLMCVISSIRSSVNDLQQYLICFLFLQSILIGFFSTTNLFLFYVFFELMLIPMYIIIGKWGGENRVYASFKFFLYTFFGSLFFLLSIVYINHHIESLCINSLPKLVPELLNSNEMNILWICMMIAFAIKIPMIPFHTWLPDAHVQAPTEGSVILAGVLLKVAGYGMIKVLIPIFPETSAYYANYVIIFSIIAIVYASFVAIAQEDMKKMIAYSSIAHMGYVTAGIFSFTKQGFEGAIFQMFSHGIISAALFFVVGFLYSRMHTKKISLYGGVANKMPILATFFMISLLGSIGLPSTSGFIGEFLTLSSIFYNSKSLAIIASAGIALGAVYMLNLYKNVMLGPMANKNIENLKDLSFDEYMIIGVLGLFIIIIGIYPNSLLNFIH